MKSEFVLPWKPTQRIWVTFFVLITLLLPTSCLGTPAPLPTPLPTASPFPTLSPSQTQALKKTEGPTPSSTPHSSRDNESLITEPLLTGICSPLAVQPLDQITEIITQPFLMPRALDDGSYKDDGHHGLDLGYYTRQGVPFTGTPVLSALEGVVAAIVQNRPPYGGMILIETPFEKIPPQLIQNQNILPGNSLYILYAHLQNLQPFTLHQTITCGQQLAETGLTGFTSGPHLHFETRWGPADVSFPDGMAYYRADTSEAERANYQRWRMSGEFRPFDPLELLTLP